MSRTLSSLLNRETAAQLVRDYCIETPAVGAVERLLAANNITCSLESADGFTGVKIGEETADGKVWTIDQDELDEVLYPTTVREAIKELDLETNCTDEERLNSPVINTVEEGDEVHLYTSPGFFVVARHAELDQ